MGRCFHSRNTFTSDQMVEEEIFRPILISLLITMTALLGSNVIYNFILSQKIGRFYKQVNDMIRTMIYMRNYLEKPSFMRFYIEIPSYCHLSIDNSSNTISYGCSGKRYKIPMKQYKIEILLIKGGKNCNINNGRFLHGEYNIVLAYVEKIPGEKQECVVYFDDIS